jgi:hypothetical protein
MIWFNTSTFYKAFSEAKSQIFNVSPSYFFVLHGGEARPVSPFCSTWGLCVVSPPLSVFAQPNLWKTTVEKAFSEAKIQSSVLFFYTFGHLERRL